MGTYDSATGQSKLYINGVLRYTGYTSAQNFLTDASGIEFGDDSNDTWIGNVEVRIFQIAVAAREYNNQNSPSTFSSVGSAESGSFGGMTMSAGSSSIIVDGDYVVRSGTTNAGSSTITINGNLDNSGTFNPGTSTVIFPADSALLGSTPPAFHTLRIESTLTAQPSTPITISGDLVNLGTFIHNDSPVKINGSAEQHIYTGGTGAGHDLYAVTVSNTGAAVTLADNPLIITTDLTIGSGADFDINGHDITVGGTFDNRGALTIHGDEALNLSMDVDSGRVWYVGDGGATADTYTIRAWGATNSRSEGNGRKRHRYFCDSVG